MLYGSCPGVVSVPDPNEDLYGAALSRSTFYRQEATAAGKVAWCRVRG
ncbi:MAG: hypothetical protein Fues2KO_19180 [Fuerstiella sp.]